MSELDEKKTSEKWYQEVKHKMQLLDPDGWDRRNFVYSWFEEEITLTEFNARIDKSTVRIFPPKS